MINVFYIGSTFNNLIKEGEFMATEYIDENKRVNIQSEWQIY